MAEKVLPSRYHWRLVAASPPREVFAVMEQMCGIPPFRFEMVSADTARIVEVERKHVITGGWRLLARTDGQGRPRTDASGAPLWRTAVRWVRCTARPADGDAGTEILVEASGGMGAIDRAIQLVRLFDAGDGDRRTLYRRRHIPEGPVSLVASWAGVPYPVYLEPSYDAPRGEGVLTATPMRAIGRHGPFVAVQLAGGAVGYIEADQVVPAPAVADRAAQPAVAELG